ncbi:MAG: molybdenum ABC transporter ATP-binding protein [Alphaproteobacteria bacterium]|nr:molybdenum ABC transporter ATP-binding protein [Alphaproteobacteria bacterium]
MTVALDIAHTLGAFRLEARIETGPGITALFGRSGSGKTTLVNIVAGLIRPDHGRLVVDGRPLVDTAARLFVPPHRRRIGYVFQEGRLFPHLSVRRNLLFGRAFTPASDRRETVADVVALLGLETLLERRPASLSGGEKQRVAIGRALLASPRVLLMDEPLAALDVARRDEILPYVERLRDERRIPIIYVSHQVPEVVRLATTVVVMDAGRIAAVGPVSEVMTRTDLYPLTRRYEAGAVLEARLAGHDPAYAMSILALDGCTLRVPQLEAAIGAPIRLRIRARDVLVATRPPDGLSAQNVLPARIQAIPEGDGPIVDIALDVAGRTLNARLTRRAVASLGLTPGQSVFAVVKSIVFDGHTVSRGPAARATDPSGAVDT